MSGPITDAKIATAIHAVCDDRLPCFWCGGAMDGKHPSAVFCQPSCQVQASQWRARMRRYNRRRMMLSRRPRRRLWLRPRPPRSTPS